MMTAFVLIINLFFTFILLALPYIYFVDVYDSVIYRLVLLYILVTIFSPILPFLYFKYAKGSSLSFIIYTIFNVVILGTFLATNGWAEDPFIIPFR